MYVHTCWVQQDRLWLSQAEAEQRAAAAAREGGARQLREAEARADAAEEAVAELRLALERQQAAFALR